MSENTAPAPATTEAPQGDPVEPLAEAGKKALDEERAARRKADRELNELKKRLTEFEQRDLSEADRAKAEVEAARKDAAEARAEAARFRLATEFKLDKEDVDVFLTGADEDAMRKQAERLSKKLADVDQAARTPGIPKPDPSQGGSGAPTALNGDGLLDALMRSVHST